MPERILMPMSLIMMMSVCMCALRMCVACMGVCVVCVMCVVCVRVGRGTMMLVSMGAFERVAI